MLASTIALASWLLFVPSPDSTPASATSPSVDPATSESAEAARDRTRESSEPVWLDPSEAGGERGPLHGPVTPQIVRLAETLLDLPLGTERALAMGSRRYVFALEMHYHPPGFVGGPRGWHKGVTVYELR